MDYHVFEDDRERSPEYILPDEPTIGACEVIMPVEAEQKHIGAAFGATNRGVSPPTYPHGIDLAATDGATPNGEDTDQRNDAIGGHKKPNDDQRNQTKETNDEGDSCTSDGDTNSAILHASNVKIYRCGACGKLFTLRANLLRHQRLHTQGARVRGKPCSCADCEKALKHKCNALYQHVRKDKKLIKCENCGERFQFRSLLKRHNSTCSGEKSYTRDLCNEAMISQESKSTCCRMQSDLGVFRCEKCEKVFTRKDHLICHLRLHTGEKPYKCDDCDKRFTEQSSFIRHRRIHTGEKPYKCGHCAKAFTDKSAMKFHLRVHSEEKPYSCEECGVLFSRQGHLTRHLRRIHSRKKSHRCDDCGKMFRSRHELGRHRRTKPTERNHRCDICGMLFTRRASLKRHCLTQHK